MTTANFTTIPVRLFTSADAGGQVELDADLKKATYDKASRTKRAVKITLILVGLAIACIPVPILHFILIPLFLIAAPIAGIMRYRQTSEIVSQDIVCPSCKGTTNLAATKASWPVHTRCANCGKFIRIESRGT